jgi:hypothetical protein
MDINNIMHLDLQLPLMLKYLANSWHRASFNNFQLIQK